MTSQRLLQLITGIIVSLLAVLLLGGLLKVTGFVLSLGFNTLLLLLLVAVVIRFYSILKQKR
ncbi:MAG: hypothetical protein KDD65_10910 [Bacteroidetes bacterium]|nr:hypothetical protein [Bacteroidota bacterium]